MKTKTLWLTTFLDGGIEENWFVYASDKGDNDKAEKVFKKIYAREYGVKFNDEITGTCEIKSVSSLSKDYQVTLN